MSWNADLCFIIFLMTGSYVVCVAMVSVRTLNTQNELVAKDALRSLSWPTTSWTGEANVWESG